MVGGTSAFKRLLVLFSFVFSAVIFVLHGPTSLSGCRRRSTSWKKEKFSYKGERKGGSRSAAIQ